MLLQFIVLSCLSVAVDADASSFTIERVTTKVPFPRGLALVDGELYVLARGRVRGAGGVSAAVEDRAGTLFAIDPWVGEPVSDAEVSAAVRNNGRIVAEPTSPPFNLWDRSSNPPQRDRDTDRPYCTLRYHEPTKSFYLCAFSGIDLPRRKGKVSFSKNLTDALIRYDMRTGKWYEVERHDIAAGGSYPHHDPQFNPPPHGWLNGPDNCLAVGDQLYAVAKDNSMLVRYDLSALVDDPDAGPPPSYPVLDEHITIANLGVQRLFGHSALAYHDGMLYVASRTSSVIFRIPLDGNDLPVQPIVGEIVARFEPFDPRTFKSANITDIDIDANGRLYVICAKPSRIHRFAPDPTNVFDARGENDKPWLNLAALTHNHNMKSENVLVTGANELYVTSGDGYAYQQGAAGTVYRVTFTDP